MKVSVIVPVYNTEKYLVKCLDSLVNQTIDNIEIVAIDDGSTDNSGKILDLYAEKYPSKMVVRHKENGGQANARNLALKICKGEYIGFLDSDDFVEIDMFEKLYNKAIKNNSDYVGCAYKDLLDQGGSFIVLNEYVGNTPCDNNRKMFLGGAKVSPFINFYKRELIVDNEIYFSEGLIYEDTAFWTKIVPYIKKPVFVEESLANRVRHDNSTTTIFKADKVRNIFPVIEDIVSFYKNKGLWDDYKDEVTYFCSRVLLCSSIERVSHVPNKEERRLLVRETYGVLRKLFCDYKTNPILKQKGAINLYLRFSCPVLTFFIIFVKRLKDKL